MCHHLGVERRAKIILTDIDQIATELYAGVRTSASLNDLISAVDIRFGPRNMRNFCCAGALTAVAREIVA
jgi:hypothetical protein